MKFRKEYIEMNSPSSFKFVKRRTIMFLLLFINVFLLNCRATKKTAWNYHGCPMYIPIFLEKESNLQNFINEHRINEKGQIIRKEITVFINDSLITHDEKPLETFSLVNKYDRKGINDWVSEDVMIANGYPMEQYLVHTIRDTLLSVNNEQRGLSGDFIVKNFHDSLLYKGEFKNGSGYWKDFYYEKSTLKEEGKVKKNFKYGEWKYYSVEGALDSVKNYSISDSVDVRFPYCLFNKKEPCY